MEPGRFAVDVTSRLVGIDFGSDRSRIAIAAQLRNALAKLRTRRGLLNQELNFLLGELGEAAALSTEDPTATEVATDDYDGVAKPDIPNGVVSTSADDKKSTAVKNPEFVYSKLQQVYLSETKLADLAVLHKDQSVIQEKIVQFQQRAGMRLPPQKDQPRFRTNWDCVLDEMRWMAADFAHEDVWKRACAATLARRAADFHERKKATTQLDEQSAEIHRWMHARKVSQMVSGFWSTIRRLQYMQRNRASLDLVIQRADQYSMNICNDLTIDTNPINKYFSSSNVLCQKPRNDAVQAVLPVDMKHVLAMRDAMLRLRFTDCNLDFNEPLSNTKLFLHQKQCVAWLEAVSNHITPASFIIADDEGLGKRVSVMAWISMETAPQLIITSSLNLLRWDAELRCRHPSAEVSVYTNREVWQPELAQNTIIVTTFEMSLEDANITSQTWKCVVIDSDAEGTLDFASDRWSALTQLRTDVRILLLRNQAAARADFPKFQLSMLNFIAPKIFRNFSDFENAIRGENQVDCDGIIGHDFLNAFCLCRTCNDIERTPCCWKESVIDLQLSKRQACLYNEVVPEDSPALFQDLVRTVIRMHLICTHPDWFEPTFSSHSVLFEVEPPYAQRLRIDNEPIRVSVMQLLENFIDDILPRKFYRSRTPSIWQSACDARNWPAYFPPSRPAFTLFDSVGAANCFVSAASRLSRDAFFPKVVARRSYLDVFSDQKDNYFNIPERRFLVSESSKLGALYRMLREQYRGMARIAIVASTSQALDVIQTFLRRHRFHYLRELPIPTSFSIDQFARNWLSRQAPSVYLTTSGTLSVFSYPSLSLFSSVFIFDHDWNPPSRQLMERHIAWSSCLGEFHLHRFVLQDTFDEYVYRFANVSLDDMDFDKLLFGSFSDSPERQLSSNEMEQIISRSQASIDVKALNIWRRYTSPVEITLDALSNSAIENGADLAYLLKPFELWALRKNVLEMSLDPLAHIADPFKVIFSSKSNPPALLGQDFVPNQLPADTKLALAAFRNWRKPNSNESSILPPNVIIASGQLQAKSMQPLLFYTRSKVTPLEVQIRNFALRYKLAYDPNIKTPPPLLSVSEVYIPPPDEDDDPNDPCQWGLFASAESQAQMFRVRSALPRKKKKKLRRRAPRLATILYDDVAGVMRIRIAKKQLAVLKRKNDETPEGPAGKRPRASSEEAVTVVAPIVVLKPIAMSHPVPFSDEEDALIVCSVVLFGSNFQIVTHFLESDFIVRGRLRTAKTCSERFSYLVRRVKEVGPRLWEKLQASSNPDAPVPPLPNADPNASNRAALEWMIYRSQVRNKPAADKTYEVISEAVRIIMQHHMQCKLALRTPISGIAAETFKEALMRSHASHASALTAGHKRLMIPHANIGSTLSPRQIVELRALRDRTHESKKMSAMAPVQQITSPSFRSTKIAPMTPSMRSASVPMAMSPVISNPSDSAAAIAITNVSQGQDLDQVNGEVDQGNMFLLRQLIQKQPHMKARLVQILQRSDLTQAQKMELAAALFQSNDGSHVNMGVGLDEPPIAT